MEENIQKEKISDFDKEYNRLLDLYMTTDHPEEKERIRKQLISKKI